MAGAGEKTEKATPKRRQEARKKGQVAKSADLNGAVVMVAALFALSAYAPHMADQIGGSMRSTLAMIATPEAVTAHGLGQLFMQGGKLVLTTVGPVAVICLAAGVLSNIAQVKFKPSFHGLKPDARRLNPIQGFKNIFGKNVLFETGKNITKIAIVGAITAFAVIPNLGTLAGLVGVTPGVVMSKLGGTVLSIAQRAAFAYLVIGLIDFIYQRWRHEKSLKMDKQEIKDEAKQHAPPAEVRSAIKKRQFEAARARMMSAVPEADVVVTNPTHYAVALAYDAEKAAPEVVAKGQDLVAAQIRRIAEENEVPIVSDPPLARTLHATVEVGHQIPEDLYAAVAQLLAFVYRVAGRKVA
jgi:flagellar biosynthesis protein FlhB